MSEIKMVQQIRKSLKSDLAERGYTLEHAQGFGLWHDLMDKAGSPKNPSFACAPDDLGLSFNLVQDGVSAGHGGIRCYPGVNRIEDLLQTGRLWWTAAESLDYEIDLIPLPEDWPTIGGTICQPGGYWLNPAHRGSKLGSLMDKLIRCAGVTAFGADHFIGIQTDKITNGLPDGYYAHDKICPIVRNLPFENPPLNMHLTHATRDEFIAVLLNNHQNIEAHNGAAGISLRIN